MSFTTVAELPQPRVVSSGFEAGFLPSDARPGEMRRLTAAHLQACGLDAFVDGAVLVVSELVTNAVLHGYGSVRLAVRFHGSMLRIEVTDGSARAARMRRPGDGDEGGRGLLLVAAVARAWGVSPDGYATWAILELPAEARESTEASESTGAPR
ncbi:ATP-binding protein [Streptomyces sp. NPDC054784]